MLSMNTIIDFFVPGFSKCGTTTLFSVLNSHPEIFIPEIKEPVYFGTSPTKEKTAWFDALYTNAHNGCKKGDCSTFYGSVIMEADACRDMFANNPRAKILFIARDPVGRIESSFREMHNSAPRFGLNTPFRLEDALIEMPQIIGDTKYYSRMRTYRDRFGKNSVMAVFLEDLIADTDRVANRCYEFLGVGNAPFTNDMLPRMNRGKDKLYDSRLLRWIRCHPVLGPLLSKIGIPRQDAIATRLGLRKPFTGKIHWSEKSKALIRDRLAGDIDLVLADVGENTSRWPRYEALLKENGTI
jgi:hypothetical protein